MQSRWCESQLCVTEEGEAEPQCVGVRTLRAALGVTGGRAAWHDCRLIEKVQTARKRGNGKGGSKESNPILADKDSKNQFLRCVPDPDQRWGHLHDIPVSLMCNAHTHTAPSHLHARARPLSAR